jgi:alkaline phosphatase D
MRSLLLGAIFWGLLHAQKPALQAGPMIGAVQLREAKIWLQTTAPAQVFIEYTDSVRSTPPRRTPPILTKAEEAYTAVFTLAPLEPGTRYYYKVFLNGKVVSLPDTLSFRTLPLWRWRTPPPEFRFVIGSCAYINDPPYDRPGEPYGGEYEIFEQIAAQRPDFMVWLGDNVYLREPDWNSEAGILYRYTHTRSLPQLQKLLRICPHYAIWDDHDFGPNDSDRSFWNRSATRRAFTLFWANPSYGVPSAPEGITTFFEWGDAEFFLLDNRTYRAPNKRKTGDRSFLGEAQLEWLIDALRSSRATFKFVVCGGQILSTSQGYENMIGYSEERERLLRRIEEEDIGGVVFLTGDRHFSEISRLRLANGKTLYDITSSPLTAKPFTEAETRDKNALRVEGTLTTQRNFILIQVLGPERSRRLEVACYNSQGAKLWERTIHASELYGR